MKKILDPKNLPYFGAIVQAILFSIAGNKFFASFGWLFGLGVGAVVNWSMAIASSRVSDIAKTRKPLAYLSLTFLFCLSPVTIALTFFAPSSVFTYITWASCVDLSIVLTGAIVGRSLVAERQPLKTSLKSAQAKPANRKKPLTEFSCPHAGAGCNRKFATQNSANAHAGKCDFKPTIAMPVDVSEKKVTGS